MRAGLPTKEPVGKKMEDAKGVSTLSKLNEGKPHLPFMMALPYGNIHMGMP